MDGLPQWDQPFREVGLVALQAAVLTRRIFLPSAGHDGRSPEEWQILLALALIDTASSYDDRTASVESLAAQLSLDHDHVHELLYGLMTDGLVVVDEDQADDDEPRLTLSPRGWEAARGYVERAGRFLPGWPPERFARSADE